MTIRAPYRLTLALGSALLLAACNSSAPPPQAAAPLQPAPVAAAPTDDSLPSGAGCSGAVARWKAIADSDFKTGNVEKSVYDQIAGEISAASAACQAGRDGEARGMIAASKRKHGYPA